MSFYWIFNLISIRDTTDGTESYYRISVNQNLFIEETLWVSYLLNIIIFTLEKSPGIRADLDKDWQGWTFPQLVDALRKWTTKNPKIIPSPEKGFKCENAYQTNDKNYKHRDCVYCETFGHKANDCKTVNDIEECRLILPKKNLWFNCTGVKDRASEYLSNRSCVKCKRKYHSSICEKTTTTL